MVIPLPQTLQRADGSYHLDERTRIVAAPELRAVAEWLQGRLRVPTGLPLPLGADGAGITLSLDTSLGGEGYRVTVTGDGVAIVGGDVAGVFYGTQTLRQLLPPQVFRQARVAGVTWTVPGVSIADAPRFGWRGVMLDVARHFLPKRDVLRFIDLMALHRLNTLHLHLTDDQGWRIEIERYPLLTEVGAWRTGTQVGAGEGSPTDDRPHGGFYTHDDIREIVAFAAERCVTVVPEIELPGHVQAALAAYPELGVTGTRLPVGTRWGINSHVLNAEEATVEFFENVFDEIVELFPSPIIGAGGDECPTVQWREDARTQELIAQRGIADERHVQPWFMARIAAHLGEHGRRLYGWDELLEGPVPPSAVIACWRGTRGAVAGARLGHQVVSCPDDRAYLDYRQSERDDEPVPVGIPLDLERCYGFEPIPAELTADEAALVLGGQANIWTEHIDSARAVDFYAYPRLAAIAEALWSRGERDIAEFRHRLDEHLLRLDAYGVEYRAESGPRPWQRRPGVVGRPTSLAERARLTEQLVSAIDVPGA